MEQLLRVAAERSIRLLTSGYAVEEARSNLDRLEHRASLARLVAMVELAPEVCGADPPPVLLALKDQPIIQAATFAGATHLITGDRAHFGPFYGQSILGVKIVSLRQYLAEMQEAA